jgi:hypothetical protein
VKLVQKPAGRVIVGGLLILAGVGAGALAVSPPAAAATAVTLYVAPGATGTSCTAPDPSDACGSISTAVNVATGGSYSGDDVTIDVAAGTYDENDTISASDLDSLTIMGAGSSMTTVAGNEAGTVFTIDGGTVTINDLTITGGSAGEGGGIYNRYGSNTFTDDTLSNDTTSGNGGAIYNLDGSDTFIDDTLSSDGADVGGALFNLEGSDTFIGDTLWNDGAEGAGGAIYNYAGTDVFTEDTLANDSAAVGGGTFNEMGTEAFSASLLSDAVCTNSGGSINDGGYNVESDDSCGFGPTDVVNSSDINLATALAANGSTGPETLAIGTNSSAFEEVSPSACTITTDERDYPRPGVPGENCDAGAYELYQPAQGPPTSDSVANGTAYSNQLTLLNPSTAAGSVTWTTTISSPDVSVSPSGAVTAPATDAPGTYKVSGTMADAAGDRGNWSFSLTVEQPSCTTLTITTTSLPQGTVGQPYSFGLSACGGNPPYRWGKWKPRGGGKIPPGLTFTHAGVISGTPTKPGSYPMTFHVADTKNGYGIPRNRATATLTATIVIDGGCGRKAHC